MPKNPILKETVKVIIGEAVVLIIMFLVFVILGRFDSTVLLGGLLGACSNILYFFLMCLGLNGVIAEEDNDKQKKKLSLSYHMRLILLAVLLAVGLKLDYFNNIALIIPVLMTRPIITVAEIFGKGIK
ncbi:MAG: ATP synthase subunit I [Eubacteriales bacterium]